uniref:S-adenosylmethionine decarboxylase proenzyme n=1 Tax=Fervidicoccus fontis TaxID=683846 RepID=A0A7J3ZKE5_9CREN
MKTKVILQDEQVGRIKPSATRVYGRHVYGSAYECDVKKLTDEEFLRQTVIEAVKVGNMRLLEVKSWKIGLGVSVVAVILESHVSVHTWPEYGFATIDVYSCGEHTDPERAFYFIAERLEAGRVELGILDRSLV